MPGALREVLVVGGGLAGLRAVEELRRLGYDGSLTMVCEEALPPYDRPPLSKQYLAGKWDLDRVTLVPDGKLQSLDVEMRLGTRASGLDLANRRITLQDGTTLPFDGLVIATGATPRQLPGVPDSERLFTLRTLDDSTRLRRALAEPGARVVVVGAGFIGSEVASTASSLGASVTVLEALPVPLARVLGEEMGSACAGLHADHGVRLRTGVGVLGIRRLGGSDGPLAVDLADGSSIEAEAVVVGIGVRPETSWLEGSGLQLSDGIVCDSSLRAAPGVVVAGDVARWPHPLIGREVRLEHWENATEQGRHAAASLLLGEQAEPFGTVPYFWSDQYGVKIQFVGDAQPGDELRVVDGSVAERRFVACYGRGGRLVGALAFGRPRLLDGVPAPAGGGLELRGCRQPRALLMARAKRETSAAAASRSSAAGW